MDNLQQVSGTYVCTNLFVCLSACLFIYLISFLSYSIFLKAYESPDLYELESKYKNRHLHAKDLTFVNLAIMVLSS